MATEPNVLNVIIGPAVIYVATFGTAFPSMAAKPSDATWLAAGFRRIGYTEAGATVDDTPEQKKFIPDESITPIIYKVVGIDSTIKTILWESSFENLELAMPLTVLSNPGTGIKTLSLGSGNPLKEWSVGIQGAGIGGADSRVLTVWRVNSVSTTSLSMSRKDITKLSCTFTALTDSGHAATKDVWDYIDFGAGS